jgi:hypothetical protein
MKRTVFRPTLDDIERLSYGKGAKRRGTGSKYVPHRLNADERTLYNFAKEHNYLCIQGTGYRRERKGKPLCNTFRQRCDALNQLCVVIERRRGGDVRVMIDFSTLRVRNDMMHRAAIMENVLNVKYPHLTVCDNCSGERIDWNTVQCNPIWNVMHRLVVVDCADKTVARELAVDVLKEGDDFYKIVDECDPIVEEEKSYVLDCGYGTVEANAVILAIEDDVDVINWDDI